MTQVGTLISLYYSPLSGRKSSEVLHFDTKGIVNDKHYDKNAERSVLITSLESYALLKKHDVSAAYGSLGENLLMDYNPYQLKTGTRLKIGSVTLEISQHCTLCKSLTQVNAKIPKLLKNDRGIFAKVIESGSIAVDDGVYLLD